MCSLQRNYDVIRNWARFETGPLTVPINKVITPTTEAMTAINKDKSGSESGSIPIVHPCNSSMPAKTGNRSKLIQR